MKFESLRNPKRYFGDTYTGSVRISRDGNRQVPFESHLERDWLIRTDAFDFRLKSVVAQPRVHSAGGLPYRFEGKERIWIPDFVRVRHGLDGLQDPPPVLIEVKPLIRIYPVHRDPRRQAFLRWRAKARWRVIRLEALSRGFGFELATEREIRVMPSLANAALMRRCADTFFPARWENVGRLALLRLPHESSIPELARVLPSDIDAFSVALRLAWRGELVLDPSKVWSRTTKFARD
ncbi:hypothetical protein [Bradyrhizobium diazoefficiens]